jgi:hypothetical protein
VGFEIPGQLEVIPSANSSKTKRERVSLSATSKAESD